MSLSDKSAFPGGEHYKTRDLSGNTYESSKAPLHRGLTIRQHFAALAMQGLLSNPHPEYFTADGEASIPLESWQDYACAARQAADALIAELEKEARP